MNTVCIVIGVIFLIFVIVGWIRGFFKVLISVAGLIVSIIVGLYAAPHISGYLQENTDIDDKLAVYIAEKLEFSEMGEETSKGIQVALIDNLPLPDVMKDNIRNNNNLETYDVLKVTGVYDYIAKSVSVVIINGAVFLVLTLICRIVFFFVGIMAKGLLDIPILKSFDKIGGGLLGVVKGLIFIWIFFLILSITSTMSWSQNLIAEISQSAVLKLLYDNNILLDIVGDLTKVLFL